MSEEENIAGAAFTSPLPATVENKPVVLSEEQVPIPLPKGMDPKVVEGAALAWVGLQNILGNFQGFSRSFRAAKFEKEKGDILICFKVLDSFLSDKDCVFEDQKLLEGFKNVAVEKDPVKLTLSDGFSIMTFNVSPKTQIVPARLVKHTKEGGIRMALIGERVKAINTRVADLKQGQQPPAEPQKPSDVVYDVSPSTPETPERERTCESEGKV